MYNQSVFSTISGPCLSRCCMYTYSVSYEHNTTSRSRIPWVRMRDFQSSTRWAQFCYKKMTGETWLNTESITSTGWTNNPFTVQKKEWDVYCIVLAVVTAQMALEKLLQTVLWVCLQKRIFMSNKSSFLDLQYCIKTCIYQKLATVM